MRVMNWLPHYHKIFLFPYTRSHMTHGETCMLNSLRCFHLAACTCSLTKYFKKQPLQYRYKHDVPHSWLMLDDWLLSISNTSSTQVVSYLLLLLFCFHPALLTHHYWYSSLVVSVISMQRLQSIILALWLTASNHSPLKSTVP